MMTSQNVQHGASVAEDLIS